MGNMIEYVKYYGTKTFEEAPFNDIDSLVLSNLSYIDFEKGMKVYDRMSVLELGKIYFSKVEPEEMKGRPQLFRETYDLFRMVYLTKRYQNLTVHHYVDCVDDQKQFGAITFRYERKWVYIAFEGTDSSVIGWKEDFDMSHTFPVPSQVLAIQYLTNEISFFDKTVYVGGHSKGGNLAVVSSMYCPSKVQKKIKTIYNFDGPGLRDEEFQTVSYRKIKNKVKTFVPEESIIGFLLNQNESYTVVKSDAKGLWQHDSFSWKCFGSFFIEDKLSEKSENFRKELDQFLIAVNEEDRAEILGAVYTIFQKANIENIEHITFAKVLKAVSYIPELRANKKVKEHIRKVLGIFIAALRI